MTVEFALDFIPRRMQEFGFGSDYLTRWKFLQIPKNKTLRINADNEYYYLISPTKEVRVASKFGVFDLNDTSINEQLYEFRGKIGVKNVGPDATTVLFIQVIPLHKKQNHGSN